MKLLVYRFLIALLLLRRVDDILFDILLHQVFSSHRCRSIHKLL